MRNNIPDGHEYDADLIAKLFDVYTNETEVIPEDHLIVNDALTNRIRLLNPSNLCFFTLFFSTMVAKNFVELGKNQTSH